MLKALQHAYQQIASIVSEVLIVPCCCIVCRDSETNVTRSLVVINVYCPRAELGNAERLEYKLQFYRLLQLRAEAILDSGR